MICSTTSRKSRRNVAAHDERPSFGATGQMKAFSGQETDRAASIVSTPTANCGRPVEKSRRWRILFAFIASVAVLAVLGVACGRGRENETKQTKPICCLPDLVSLRPAGNFWNFQPASRPTTFTAAKRGAHDDDDDDEAVSTTKANPRRAGEFDGPHTSSAPVRPPAHLHHRAAHPLGRSDGSIGRSRQSLCARPCKIMATCRLSDCCMRPREIILAAAAAGCSLIGQPRSARGESKVH